MESDGRERGVSISQILLVPTGNLLVFITLSTGACFTDRRPQKHGTGSRSHQKSVALTQPRPPEPSLIARLPILQDAGTPAGVPLPGSALRAGCRRVGGSARPKAAGHDCWARRKAALTERARLLSPQLGTPLRAGRNCCRGNRRAASSQRAHPQGMFAL